MVKTIEDNQDHQQNHYIIQTLRIYKEKFEISENPKDEAILTSKENYPQINQVQ